MIQNITNDKEDIKKYISKKVHNFLKSQGFKKHDINNFYKQNDSCLKVINIQYGRFHNKSEYNFTINWEIFIPQFFVFRDIALPKHGFFKSETFLLGGRLSEFANFSQQYSWISCNLLETNLLNNSIDSVIQEISEILIPFFSKINNLDDLIKLLKKSIDKEDFYSFYPTINQKELSLSQAYLFNNQKYKAIKIIDDIIQNSEVKEGFIALKKKIEKFNNSLCPQRYSELEKYYENSSNYHPS